MKLVTATADHLTAGGRQHVTQRRPESCRQTLDGAALGADAGCQYRGVETGEIAARVAVGGTHHQPDRVVPARVQSGDLVDHDLGRVMLDPRSLRVGGACQHVNPPALRDGQIDGGQQRPDPEVRAECDGVSSQR